MNAVPGMKPWQHFVFRIVGIYFGIGLCISFTENLWGAAKGSLSAFVWTGSLQDNALLLCWWFIIPAMIWPYDLGWALYWKVFGA